MSVEILYDGNNNFSGISNIPLVSRDITYIQYGERYGVAQSIELNGTITGECGSFESLVTGQGLLLKRFGQDYKTLEIKENGNTVSNFYNCEIQNISFNQSRYVGVLDYTINLLSYPEEFFSGSYGILDPVNQWSFTENEDGTINIEHEISARGFNTNENYTNSLDNARNYVNTKTGWNNDIDPAFIQTCSGLQPCLQEQRENINRFNGSYSITEIYIADPKWNSGILRYVSEINSGIENGITTVSINGKIDGCKNESMDKVRQRYENFDIYSQAVEIYSGFSDDIQLNPYYNSSGIQDNEQDKTLSFNVTFDNDSRSKTTFDYNINYQTDILNDITSVSFRGTIRGRGDLKTRWQRVQEYYSGFNFADFVQEKYNEELYSSPLNPNYITSGITRNSFEGILSVNLTYNNEDLPPSGLEKFDYNISLDPSIHKYVSKPLIYGTGDNPEYDVQDLGYASRARLRINGEAIASENNTITQGISIVKNELNFISAKYLQGYRKILEENNFSQKNDGQGKSFSFNVSWSSENPEFTLIS